MDRKHTYIMEPTRLFKYVSELREEDSICKNELSLPFLRLVHPKNDNTNDKSRSGNWLKMTNQLNHETMVISSENIRGPSDMKIKMKYETVKTNSTGNPSRSRRAEFTGRCSININKDQNKSDELQREHFLNSKYVDLSYPQMAEQRMRRHLKTILKTVEFEKENRLLNPSSQNEQQRLNVSFDESPKENLRLNLFSFGGSQKENQQLNLSSFLDRSQKENQRLNLSSFAESQKENQRLNPSSFAESQKENQRLNLSSFGGSQKENQQLNLSSFAESQKENQRLNLSSFAESQKENQRLNLPFLDKSQKENTRLKTLDGSQNIGEALRCQEASIFAAFPKRIFRNPPNNITPLDPQVELLISHIDRYPSIYVTETGFINILLRQGILLEVTVDKAFRLVDLNQDMAATISGRTKACSVNHRLGVICQSTSSADFDLGDLWQAKIRAGHITVGDRCQVAWFDKTGNFSTSEYNKYHFVDMNLTDYTVDLLLFSASYGPAYVPICKKLVSSAKFESTNIGSVTVQVNGVKIIQRSHGDVIVMSGSKLLKMRPRTQSVEIYAGSTKIDVSPEWGVTCHLRNSMFLTCSNEQLTVSNGSIESRLKGNGQINLRKISDIIY